MKTFADYGIRIPAGATGETKALCPKCSHLRKKKNDPCLNVNIQKGTWHCWNDTCDFSGALPPDEYIPPAAVKESFKPPTPQELTPDVIQWFSARGIAEETIREWGVKTILHNYCVDGQWVTHSSAAIPFVKNGQIVNYKYRSVKDKLFSQSKGGEQCFVNLESIADSNVVVVTEGELDAMAVHQSGVKQVISCPAGAAGPKTKRMEKKLEFIKDPYALAYLDRANHIILAMDCDETGIYWRDLLAKEIGVEKCRIAEYPAGCKDMNDVLLSHGPEVVRECLMNAKAIPVAGIEKVEDKRNEIETYYMGGGIAKGFRTGWDGMNNHFNIVPGQLTIVTGIPQSGKSEWMDQLMLQTIDLHKWNWAVFSPENYPISFHFQKLAEKYIGKPMFGENGMEWAHIEQAMGHLQKHLSFLSFDDDAPKVDDVLLRLKICKERDKITAAIIDPYNEISHPRKPGVSETEYIGDFLSKMRRFARTYEIALFIVAHPTKLQKREDGNYPVPTPYDINGGANWRNKADNCISVWRKYKLPPDPTPKDKAIMVSVSKVRNKNIGECGSCLFTWDRPTGRFTELDAFEPPEWEQAHQPPQWLVNKSKQ